MKFRKKVLDTMERCYAAASITANGRLYALLASEAVDGPCYAYTGEDFSEKEVVWENGGGTMSLVQIPGVDGEFIAVQRFYPGFKSEQAKLVWGRRGDTGWTVRDLAPLPFVHRFDLFRVHDDIYILAATLCGSKKDREDWSDPGKVYVGKLPATPEEGVQFTPILENLYKNHGYCRGSCEGRDIAFVTHEDGVCAILPPAESGGEWTVRYIIEGAVGDVAAIDLDGDGTDELVTIEPFHGDSFVVRKLYGEEYREVFRYSQDTQFAHAVVGCSLRGKPSVVCGARRGAGDLFILQHGASEKEWCDVTIIESGVGPSNAAVIKLDGADVIVSANHTLNEAALYFVTE